MNQLKFLLTLADTTKAYSWTVDGNRITGVARNGADRGRRFDPLTAACRYTTNKTYPNTKRGRQSAARVLGLSKLMSNSVQDATQAATNRGHAQVMRGHIKQVLGL